jgi:hypothetical protein
MMFFLHDECADVDAGAVLPLFRFYHPEMKAAIDRTLFAISWA